MQEDNHIVYFQREEGADNYRFLATLDDLKIKLSISDGKWFDCLSNDGNIGLAEERITLVDQLRQEKQWNHYCQLRCFKMPDGSKSLSVLSPKPNGELDPFCIGLFYSEEMDCHTLMGALQRELPYVNAYVNNDLWEYETWDAEREKSIDVCGGFLSMDEAVTFFFSQADMDKFTIICDGDDRTDFFQNQFFRAQLRKILSESLPAQVVSDIVSSISDEDIIKTITKSQIKEEQPKEAILHNIRR